MIYLSVDFYYSIYEEKINTEGEKEQKLKYSFQAEKCTVDCKPNNNIIEIIFSSIGIIWNSKKVIKFELDADHINEFLLHYQQSKVIMKSDSRAHLYQSSIVTKGEYGNDIDKSEIVDSQVIGHSHINKNSTNRNIPISTDSENQNDTADDNSYSNDSKLYTSERGVSINQFGNELSYFDKEKLKNFNFSKNRNMEQIEPSHIKYSSEEEYNSQEYISEPQKLSYENQSQKKNNSEYSNSFDDIDDEYSNSSFKD